MPNSSQSNNETNALKRVLFVDAGVSDAEQLLGSVSAGTEIIHLTRGVAPLEQIAGALVGKSNLEEVHLLAHGEPGAIALAGSNVDAAAIEADSDSLKAIGGALGNGAKLALWACSVAAGKLGSAFTQALEAATGARVFAAGGLVGAADKGGSWNIGTAAPFSDAAMASYGHTLPTIDGVGGSSNNEDYIEADGGVTVTTTFTGDAASTPASGGAGGASGNFWSAAGFTTTSVTVTFDTAVTVTSFVYLEADTTAEAGNYTFTVTTGDGTTIVLDETDFSNIAGADGVTLTPVDWFNVTEITITSNVGGGNWTPGLDTLTFNVNTAPTSSINNAALTYDEGDGAVLIDAAATVSDADGDLDWNTGSLVAQITAAGEADDRISISDLDADGITITVSGTDILANGVDVGNVSASGGTVSGTTALTITWDEDATNAIVQEVLQSLRYASVSEDPGESNRIITVSATDGSGDSAVDTRTIQVSAVEDAPTVTGLTNRGAAEDVTGALDFSAVTISDSDTPGNITVTITAGDTGAVLGAVDGSGVGAGVTETASGNNVVTLVGTAADITTYLGNASAITYTSSQDRETDDTISIQADDGISTPNVASTASIVMTPVNDLPTASDNSVSIDQGSSHVFTAANFNFADVDTGDTLQSVRIDTLTLSSGTFQLSGADVSATDVITVADINAGNLVYTPAADSAGQNRLVFTFSVNDGTGFAASTSAFDVDIIADVSPIKNVGGSGNNAIKGAGGNDTLIGGAGDDVVTGGGGHDQIWAGSGDQGADSVNGGAGNDTIGGGGGDDLIEGGTGSDILFGGAGDDRIYVTSQSSSGDDSSNEAWGGRGNDTIIGDVGDDVVGGGTGNDVVTAGRGNDVVFAGTGDDDVNGDSGDDTIYGGQGADNISGGAGNDLLFNGADDDTVDGGTGADTLWGGAGDDVLTGGEWTDTFAFTDKSGNDTVTDFELNEDTLDLRSLGFEDGFSLGSIASAATVDGQSGVLLELSENATVFLQGLSLDDLSDVNLVL